MVRVVYILLLEIFLQCAVFVHYLPLCGCREVLLESIADTQDAVKMVTDSIPEFLSLPA